jgi:hypothetical protein
MSSRAEASRSNARRTLRLRFAGAGGPEPEPPSPAPETGAPSVAETEPDVAAVPRVPTGPTRVTKGDLHPRHVDFKEIGSTPNGHSVWRIIYGTQLSGGLAGETEDVEFQILEFDGTGVINSAGTFTGRLDGRPGGFVFKSEGVQNADGSFVMDFAVVPGTGHGELAGLAGRYTVVATREHCRPEDTPDTCETLVSYTFAYRLPGARKSQAST